MGPKPVKAAALVILLTAVMLFFSPSLRNGFTNWDDDGLLTDNLSVRDISWQNTKKIFGTFTVSTYIPLTVLSYSVEYRLWGLDPRGYHAVNLALHSVNAALVFFLFLALGLPAGPALAGSLFWAIHPLRVESVAWVTERKDVLYAFFFLGSLLSYLFYAKSGRWRYYWVSLLLFVLSCLSKGLAIVLPAALLLTDHLLKQRISRKDLLNKLPFAAVTVVFTVIGLAAQGAAGFEVQSAGHQWWHRAGVASYNLLFYLGKTIFPARLSALYPYPASGDFPWPWVLGAAPVLAMALAAAGHRILKVSPLGRWGWWFFLLTVLPVLQIIKLQGEAMAADRYLYIPAIGLAVLAGLGWSRLIKRIAGKSRIGFVMFLAGSVALAGLGGAAAYRRTKVWENSLTLWDDVISKHPQTAVAYNNRGKHLSDQGLTARALDDLNTALRLKPDYATAMGNRALVHLQSGDYGKAISDLDRAIAINPGDTRNINNRGALYVKQGDFDRALSYLNTALEINPGYRDALYNRGVLHYGLKRFDESLNDLTEAVRVDPYYAKAWLKRARLYLDLSQPDNAIKDAERTLSLEPGSVAAQNVLGLAYGMKGDHSRSLAEYHRALVTDPSYAETYNNLATIYYARHEYLRSWESLQKARQLGYKPDPNFIKEITGKVK